MRGVCIYPEHNSEGKRDADEFRREALKFAKHHEIPRECVVSFDNHKRGRRLIEHVEARLRSAAAAASGDLGCVAIFCHGFRRGIQTGHRNASVRRLADLVVWMCRPDARVILYCCDTARDADADRADDQRHGPGGDGGFADRLRDAMCAEGMTGGAVLGHTVVAHTTRAPFVRCFYTDGSATGGDGGDWVVAPRSPCWRAWRRELRKGSLRFRFPFMTRTQIEAELRG